ncbi:MAG: hypothetical protein ACLTG7_04205 [Romboutsia sp.]
MKLFYKKELSQMKEELISKDVEIKRLKSIISSLEDVEIRRLKSRISSLENEIKVYDNAIEEEKWGWRARVKFLEEKIAGIQNILEKEI